MKVVIHYEDKTVTICMINNTNHLYKTLTIGSVRRNRNTLMTNI